DRPDPPRVPQRAGGVLRRGRGRGAGRGGADARVHRSAAAGRGCAGAAGPGASTVDRLRHVQRRGTARRPAHARPAGVGPVTWLDLRPDDPFGVHNLPYGVVDGAVVARVGDRMLDLGAAERAGLLDAGGALQAPTLNAFMAQGRPQWTAVRRRLRELLADSAHRRAVEPLLRPLGTPALPFEVADYVDFY